MSTLNAIIESLTAGEEAVTTASFNELYVAIIFANADELRRGGDRQ